MGIARALLASTAPAACFHAENEVIKTDD